MVGTATWQPEEDDSATRGTGIASVNAGQPRERKATPDGGDNQAIVNCHEAEEGVGEGRVGGASTDRVAQLGGEGGGSEGEHRNAPQRKADPSARERREETGK